VQALAPEIGAVVAGLEEALVAPGAAERELPWMAVVEVYLYQAVDLQGVSNRDATLLLEPEYCLE
jgi:hypothetical protein